MHANHSMRPMYPYPVPPGPHAPAHGFCASCRHPVAQCCCRRSCRKIEKELLVQPKAVAGSDKMLQPETDKLNVLRSNVAAEPATARVLALMDLISPVDLATAVPDSERTVALDTQGRTQGLAVLRSAVAANRVAVGMDHTVIGGGCCVHLSIEYMPSTPVAPTTALAGVLVMDSKATVLSWIKMFSEGGYHVKEGIISTNPGAQLWVLSVNAITRVRWCEVISC